MKNIIVSFITVLNGRIRKRKSRFFRSGHNFFDTISFFGLIVGIWLEECSRLCWRKDYTNMMIMITSLDSHALTWSDVECSPSLLAVKDIPIWWIPLHGTTATVDTVDLLESSRNGFISIDFFLLLLSLMCVSVLMSLDWFESVDVINIDSMERKKKI